MGMPKLRQQGFHCQAKLGVLRQAWHHQSATCPTAVVIQAAGCVCFPPGLNDHEPGRGQSWSLNLCWGQGRRHHFEILYDGELNDC